MSPRHSQGVSTTEAATQLTLDQRFRSKSPGFPNIVGGIWQRGYECGVLAQPDHCRLHHSILWFGARVLTLGFGPSRERGWGRMLL